MGTIGAPAGRLVGDWVDRMTVVGDACWQVWVVEPTMLTVAYVDVFTDKSSAPFDCTPATVSTVLLVGVSVMTYGTQG